MKQFVNLTPHVIRIQHPEGYTIEVEPSGTIARVTEQPIKLREVNGIPVFKPSWGAIEGLHQPRKNTVYIVSFIVLQQLEDREDVVAPDTGPSAIRMDGQVWAVRAFKGV